MRLVLFVALAFFLPGIGGTQEIESYVGSCDASAGISLTGEIFVVGNDENNTLRYYRRGQSAPIGTLSLSSFLATGTDESDIEGAAAIGSRIYWISSHSRNSKGKIQPSRHRIFATDILSRAPPVLAPVGKPYTGLLHDLARAEMLKPYGLDAAARLAGEADGGLNIEGLAATPEGGLLIGFRNPLRDGRALIVPLLNPSEIIEGKRARLGAPIELDLGQRGIRSIALSGATYLIVAGPIADSGRFAVYDWSGKVGDPPLPKSNVALGSLRPEALLTIPQRQRVQLLSDDGGIPVEGIECKKLPASRQSFRSLTITP